MRYLVISDIHSNWDALEAVLNRASGKYERVVCCGDLVGYGPEPNRVVDWVRGNAAFVIRGNHDKAAVGMENLDWFNPVARAAALWTMGELSPENKEYIRQLPKGPLAVDTFGIAHGSPLDEDEYLMRPEEAAQAFAYLDWDVTFFGHTHIQGGFSLVRRQIRLLSGPKRFSRSLALDLNPDDAYLINPGAVGQPRDGDPRAGFALYDPERRSVDYRREEYDIPSVQDKILRAGLPEFLAVRLGVGQ